MTHPDLSADERNLLAECLMAIADGPFVRGAAFSCQTRLSRQQFREAAAMLLRHDNSSRIVARAIRNALSMIEGYPLSKISEWDQWISCSREDVIKIGQRWKLPPPKRFFHSVKVSGPVLVGGEFYRRVEYRMTGGYGGTWQVWRFGKWTGAANDPGFVFASSTIANATPASEKTLAEFEVDCSPIPDGIDTVEIRSNETRNDQADPKHKES